MSINVKFVVNGHSCEVTVEQPEMLSKAVDATIKAIQTMPYTVAPHPTYDNLYPPGFQLYKDAVAYNPQKVVSYAGGGAEN